MSVLVSSVRACFARPQLLTLFDDVIVAYAKGSESRIALIERPMRFTHLESWLTRGYRKTPGAKTPFRALTEG